MIESYELKCSGQATVSSVTGNTKVEVNGTRTVFVPSKIIEYSQPPDYVTGPKRTCDQVLARLYVRIAGLFPWIVRQGIVLVSAF